MNRALAAILVVILLAAMLAACGPTPEPVIQTVEVDRTGHPVIELNAVPVRLVLRLQRQRRGVDIDVGPAIVHENHICITVQRRDVLVPNPLERTRYLAR